MTDSVLGLPHEEITLGYTIYIHTSMKMSLLTKVYCS